MENPDETFPLDDTPAWICRVPESLWNMPGKWNHGITVSEIDAVCEGGCASGAWMPAVTYWEAQTIMNEHGDDVLEFIEDILDEAPSPERGSSWSAHAVHYLSMAVEMWCSGVHEQALELGGEEQ